MVRVVTNLSKLGAKIRESGLPVYAVAGATHISYTRLLRYVNLHQPIAMIDLQKLAEFLDCHPEDLIGPNWDELED